MSIDQLFAFIPDAAFAVDPDGQIVAANIRAEQLFGYASGSLVGEPVDRLVPERLRSGHPGLRSGYQRNPHIRPMAAVPELCGRRRDASEFAAEIMLEPVTTVHGRLVIAVVSDVSWRGRRQAEARLAAIVESSSDAILAKDTDGMVTAWNAAAEGLYGFTPQEIVGRPVKTIIPDERWAQTTELMARVFAGETIAAHRTVRVNKAGESIDVSLAMAPIRDEHGEVVGASSIARGITHELETEAEARYTHTLVHSSVDAIMGIDQHGFITAWNPAAERIFGYSAAEAIGRDARELGLAAAGPAEVGGLIGRVLAGESLHYEVPRRSQDGRDLIISATLSPVRDEHGNVSGAVSVARDVTAARQATTDARAASERTAALQAELNQTQRLKPKTSDPGGAWSVHRRDRPGEASACLFGVAEEAPRGCGGAEERCAWPLRRAVGVGGVV